MSKQDQVVEMVKAGIYSRQEIREDVGCTSGALASYFSGMRNAAKYTPGHELCPVEVEKEVDGAAKKVMVVMTFEAAEALKAEKAATSKSSTPAKTPVERLALAEKRVTKCATALDNANKRAEDNPENREMELRAQKASIEAELADIELERCKELVASEEAAEEAPEADEEELI